MRLLCIDPSIKALGWAYFIDDVTCELVDSGVITLTSKEVTAYRDADYTDFEDDWIVAVDAMSALILNEMVKVVNKYGTPSLALIEMPWVRGGATGEAAQGSGAILKLMALVFQLRSELLNLSVDVTLVPVPKWKGNVPKEITQGRARKHWGWEGTDHNEGDAVGIGDWYFRKYLG